MLGALVMASCSDIDDQNPLGGSLTADQLQDANVAIPERTEATFAGMFTIMGEPCTVFGSSGRPDDCGFIGAFISLDAEASDYVMTNSGYNWFSTASELSSRDANYANPYIRYVIPYRQIGIANSLISSYPADTQDPDAINKIAQARAIRAYDYLALAPYFQASYSVAADMPCVPILSDTVDFTNNPRATVKQVYDYILEDLNYAVANLTTERADKSKINVNVAYGLRARAYLNMGKYAEAAADAAKAMEGYTPASISDVSVPAFCDINEANWIWGIDITDKMVEDYIYSCASAWITPFSGNGYAAACQVTPMINSMLWKKIPATDVRKGWWIDENLHSPNIANLTWGPATGDAICTYTDDAGTKVEFLPYTNVKFGQKSGVANILNSNDFPLMRVEEMILIQAEGLAKSGKAGEAKTVLENFVKTYRDPSYTVSALRSLEDEIWFQRRVELWGEGFGTSDVRRLNKPIVRFIPGVENNWPDAFKFNIAPTDGWLNMRFPQDEMDNNLGIIDNTEGSQPVSGQNPELRDGVTD